MVNIYALNIEKLPDPAEEPGALAGLAPARREKTLKFRLAPDRKRSLGAGLLLLDVLSKFGADYKEIRLASNGKPEADGICFNLSHSGSYVICAVGEHPVGCDVEQVKKAPGRIAEHFFFKSEIQYIEKQDGPLQDEAFFRIWTMKESYMKMTGEGISLPLNEFEIILLDEEFQKVRRGGDIQPCAIRGYKLPGYQVSVCTVESDFAKEIELWDYTPEHIYLPEDLPISQMLSRGEGQQIGKSFDRGV